MKHYDIAVIGAGSGGLVAATSAHRRGAKVALLEKNKIGGECTHSGCIPSKTLISSARAYQATKHTETLGLPKLDATRDFSFGAVMEHVDRVVQSVYAHETPQVFQDAGIDVFVHASGAQFIDSRQIRIGDESIKADFTIISTGSSPRPPKKMGGAPLDYLDNESFWQLRTMPASLVFLGGGVIAAELGQVMARFGCEVTIIDRNPRILKVVDEEVGALATRILQDDGIHIMTEMELTSCESLPTGRIKLHLERTNESEKLEAERIFVALGRIPNTVGLQLEQADVDYDERRGVITNEYLQTTADNIYACGDVTARPKFTHTASYQADVCVENILQGNHVVNDLSVLPWVIYTEPEIAHVGMSKAEARQKVPNHRIFKVDAATVDRFVTEGKTVGFLKILMDENDAVIGADGIGAHSGEWIQIITMAIKHNLSIHSITDTIFAYPTFSEVVKKAFSRYLRTRM